MREFIVLRRQMIVRWRRRRPLGLRAIALLLMARVCLVPPAALSGEIPPELTAAVAVAEADGLALFKAVQQFKAPTPEAAKDARNRISNFCDFDYKATLASLSGATAIYFLLAETARSDEIVFGRHFKVAGAHVTESTNACYKLGPVPRIAVAAC